jgi:hypothetical protein
MLFSAAARARRMAGPGCFWCGGGLTGGDSWDAGGPRADLEGMSEPVWIHARYQSAYGLPGAMALELCDGLREDGHEVRTINLATDPHPERGGRKYAEVQRPRRGRRGRRGRQ